MSGIFTPAKVTILTANPGAIDFDGDTLKAALVSSSDYTTALTDQFKSAVTSYAGTTDQTLTGVNVATVGTTAVLDALDALFSAVAVSAGKVVDRVLLYKYTGVLATSPLIAIYDGFTSVTPNGGDITVQWDNGASKILRIP